MFRVKDGKMVEEKSGDDIPIAYVGDKPTHFIAAKQSSKQSFENGIYLCVHQPVGESSACKICPPVTVSANGSPIRKFETGATRDTDEGKYDYEAFFSPLVLERRAKYMHQHRVQPDGSLRAGDNWQKGIPLDQYAKSEARHHQQFLKLHRGYPTFDEKGNPVDLQEAICALLFNLEGYLFELLKKELK